MPAAAPATPAKPNTAAISATTKNINVQRNIKFFNLKGCAAVTANGRQARRGNGSRNPN
jgi:hypothetical protein